MTREEEFETLELLIRQYCYQHTNHINNRLGIYACQWNIENVRNDEKILFRGRYFKMKLDRAFDFIIEGLTYEEEDDLCEFRYALGNYIIDHLTVNDV